MASDILGVARPSRGPLLACDFDHAVLPGGALGALQDAIGDAYIVGHHATRLLEHEARLIRTQGLRPLTLELVHERLASARLQYPHLLDAADADLLAASGPLTWDDEAWSHLRRGRVWMGTTLPFLVACSGRLLEDWGGEAIAWAARREGRSGDECRRSVRRLSAASAPAVVTIAVPATEVLGSAAVWRTFVGTAWGLSSVWTEWSVSEVVTPAAILDIVAPGNPGWPRDPPWSLDTGTGGQLAAPPWAR
jgi:hypothetical protein